jgi:hypothetical protein
MNPVHNFAPCFPKIYSNIICSSVVLAFHVSLTKYNYHHIWCHALLINSKRAEKLHAVKHNPAFCFLLVPLWRHWNQKRNYTTSFSLKTWYLIILLCYCRNLCSSVSIETGLRAVRPVFSSRQGQWWSFSFRNLVQAASGAHPSSYSMGTEGSFPGDKSTGMWSYTSAPQYVFMMWVVLS